MTSAVETGTGVVAFSMYTLESAVAVRQAAERRQVPVILQAGAGCFDDVGLELLADLMLAAADGAAVPIGVHLDHSRDLRQVERSLGRGFTSVMYDGSHDSFEDNVTATAEAAELAHAHGAWIEGELGAIAGDEDVSGVGGAAELTDPEAAREFVRRTGVDALAVAVGNVHGATAVEPGLDLQRLAAIRHVVEVPLVLHGASGLPRDQLRQAVRGGAAKINVNTELRRSHLGSLVPPAEGDDLRVVRRRAIEAMDVVADRFLAVVSA